jgi:diguanylate cyclase (GGDEF)-like protein
MDEMRTGNDLLAEEWTITRADGEKRTVTISTSVLQGEEGVPYVLAVMADITERKQAEEALRKANETLQAQLSEINILHETLREQAVRDPLTGLYNRRYLSEAIQREISRARRKDYLISVMIVDIDNFKQFNDSYGHDFGDEILIALGSLLQNNVRIGDIACRFGGDEFIVIMPDIKPKDAEHRAQMLVRAINTMPFQQNGTEISASVSIGVALYPQHGSNSDDLFRCADAALYHAKQAGRNCVQVWEC